MGPKHNLFNLVRLNEKRQKEVEGQINIYTLPLEKVKLKGIYGKIRGHYINNCSAILKFKNLWVSNVRENTYFSLLSK